MDSDEPKPAQSGEDEPIEARIERLKEQARAVSGGQMVSGMAPGVRPEVEEQFWKHVLDFENLPAVLPFDVLVQSGMSLPAPDELSDSALTAKLWETIKALADLGMFLHFTDHLSDRELYTRLWTETLRVPTELDPNDQNGAWHIDMSAGNETDDGVDTYLKYYADESARTSWAREWPDDALPEPAKLPYDRDRHLP